MMIYFGTSLMISLNASDVLDFIKKYLIISIIGNTSFDINRRYFTSGFRKKQLMSKI